MTTAEATARARALGAIIRELPDAPGGEGQLAGLAISVKDNVSVAGFPTTGATKALANLVMPEAAPVSRVRAAGARITAKTNLHELAFGVTSDNRWSGPVRNPFDATKVAGGSSGGAAVSVAVGEADVAIATDTGGSSRIPAAFCGVVGFRPSTGRYPGGHGFSGGIISLSPSRDTIGLLARSAERITLVDGVITGDSAQAQPHKPQTLGVVSPASFGLQDYGAVEPLWQQALERLGAAGIALQPVDLSAAVAVDHAIGMAIVGWETPKALAGLMADGLGAGLADLVAGVASPDVRLALAMPPPPRAVYEAALAEIASLRQHYATALIGVDALLHPTTLMTAPLIKTGADADDAGALMDQFTAITTLTRADSMAGMPSVSLPMGMLAGMPGGLQLVGRRHADRQLLGVAQVLEPLLPAVPIIPNG